MPRPDLEALEAELARAEELHQAMGSAHDRFRHRRDRLVALAVELRDRAAAWPTWRRRRTPHPGPWNPPTRRDGRARRLIRH